MKRRPGPVLISVLAVLLVAGSVGLGLLILHAIDGARHRVLAFPPAMSDSARTALEAIVARKAETGMLSHYHSGISGIADIRTGTAYPFAVESYDDASGRARTFTVHSFEVPAEPQGWIVLLRMASSDEPVLYVSIVQQANGDWVEHSYGALEVLDMLQQYEAVEQTETCRSPLVVEFSNNIDVLVFTDAHGDEVFPTAFAAHVLRITRYSSANRVVPLATFLDDVKGTAQAGIGVESLDG